MNNKSQISYKIVLNKLYNLITYHNKINLKVSSISTNFELALINATKNVFKKVRHVGCLFHFIKNIGLNLSKLGLFNNIIKNQTTDLLIDLSTIPLRFKTIILYLKKYSKNIMIFILILNLEFYIKNLGLIL